MTVTMKKKTNKFRGVYYEKDFGGFTCCTYVRKPCGRRIGIRI